MYSPQALLDIHDRASQSIDKLLEHCAQLSASELNREIEGFGYPTVRLQLHHAIGAQKYWMGVLEGRIDADEDAPDYPDLESLVQYRRKVCAGTERILRETAEVDLNTARPMKTWGDRELILVPARVFLRTQTHLYHHQGQIVAMCRFLGKPASGFDFPIL